MTITEMLNAAVDRNASDLHLIKGTPPTLRVDGDLYLMGKEPVTDSDLVTFFNEIVQDQGKKKRFLDEKELDLAYEIRGKARFRVNLYYQRGSIAISIRAIPARVPRLEDLNLPTILREIIRKPNGLVLVTGPTGSGKSTTLAALIDLINEDRSLHIVTIEDPIEYVYQAKRSIVSQREVGEDTLSFPDALRHVLRQDPDVILIGEARDLETMQAAITAAETGHLVFSTLHTTSAAQTIDRIIDIFPPHQQEQIRSQLSITLQAVVSQRLLKKVGKGRVPATEILVATPGVKNLVREGKTHQLYNAMELGMENGMHTLEYNLNELVAKKMILWEDAYALSNFKEYIKPAGSVS